MFRNILVATGGSPWSDAAVAYAIAIAARTGAELRILNVLRNPGDFATPDVMGGGMVVDLAERQGQELVAAAANRAQQAGVPAETVCKWGSVHETILQTAAESPCDLVVLGARMITGWKRLRLGNIANAVAAKARQPVLVVKQPPTVTPGSPLGRRLLVASGGSPWSDLAVDYAIALAQSEHFSICLLHVVEGKPKRRDEMAEREGQHILARGETRAADAGVSTTTVMTYGDIARTIVDTAVAQECDGIIIGARPASGWKRLMLGNISNAVTVSTTLPVLVVKPRGLQE